MHRLTFTCAPTEHETRVPTLRVAAFLDGKELPDGLLDVTGIIFGGAVARSSFYFHTCSCGVPGCEGYHIPLEHRRENGQVIWTIEDEKLKGVFGAETITFDEAQFDAAREALLGELKAQEAKGAFAEGMTDTDWDENNNEFIVGIKLDEVAERLTPYYEGQTSMAAVRDAAADPNFPGMLRYSWGYHDDPASERFWDMPAVEIAAILLRLGESLSEEDAPKVSELPRATEILRDLARDGDIERATMRFEPLRRFLIEDDMNENGAPIFFRDDKGVFVRHP